MKIKSDFMLRNIADYWIVVPLGARVIDFNGLITLSETGAFLWKKLQDGAERDSLVVAVLEEYDVDEYTAFRDVEEFLDSLIKSEVLES